MSQCKKFAPNIFHKTKCSNCFRQKEEHSAEALECNRASRSIARSGYLFVAPDWDFSVPLNRTKRWQRRWFVLYDDGELNYSVDEHPDTIPQGSVDMSKVLEVTGAEQVTGHPHSLALTSPDRVTFVKAASREDARWWAELLAVFPRRHKRNATFPGGRASPSLPQLGRSASPQPPRPRHLSCSGPSPRTNFETPPLKEERESPPKEEQPRPDWVPEPTGNVPIEPVPSLIRNDYLMSSGSPPTRDKLRCDEKTRVRRDWRNERLRDIATALTDQSPESSLALPAESLLHLKKGWLWLKNPEAELVMRWAVLCGPTLNIYQSQDEQGTPEVIVEMSTVTSYNEIPSETKFGFEIKWAGGSNSVVLFAVTSGIRSNWLQALKKAVPASSSSESPTTPRSVLFSSDEEYRTASEGGRRGSEDWGELPPSPPLSRTLSRVKTTRVRPRLPRCQSRQSTLDSTSTDELDCVKLSETVELNNEINKQNVEINDLQKQLAKSVEEVKNLEEEIARLKKFQADAVIQEKKAKEMMSAFERTERELNQRNSQAELKFTKEQRSLQRRLAEAGDLASTYEEKCSSLSRELQNKQRLLGNLQEELASTNDRLARSRDENDRLFKRIQELEGRNGNHRRNSIRCDSLTDLTNIDLDIDIDELGQNELKEYCLDLRGRFEKAVLEIRAVKRELREAHEKCDSLELVNYSLQNNLEMAKQESQAEISLLVSRLEHLTQKLNAAEKQVRSKSKSESRDKRRSLSLKGRESFSINKEVEDKVTELEAKILALERNRTRRKHKRERSSERSSPIDDKSLRRLRRKSLDSATSSEPMKLLMRLSTLENQVTNVNASNESLNLTPGTSGQNPAKTKIEECLAHVAVLKNSIKRSTALTSIEQNLNELSEIVETLDGNITNGEIGAINASANAVVKQLQNLLLQKLRSLNEKKRVLRESNQLSAEARLEILAEKVAYENILIGRIQEALTTPATGEVTCERLVDKEVKETAHLITSLQKKLNGGQTKPPSCKTSADYLSKILAKCLMNAASGATCKNFVGTHGPSMEHLQREQKKLSEMLESYKITKLPQLAETLAVETLSIDKNCRLKKLSDDVINDFSRTTKDVVNSELVESEINHVLLRAAQIYQGHIDADHSYFFTFFASERAALELWSDSVGDCLYEEINKNITELTEVYLNQLNKLQRQNWRRRVESERNSRSSSVLLQEFADIIAHKSLIDARMDVLNGKCPSGTQFTAADSTNRWLQNDIHWDCLENQSVQINQSVEAEFSCMLDRCSRNCYALVGQPELEEVLEYLNDLSDEIGELQKQANVPVDYDDVVVRNWSDVCSKCRSLRDKLEEVRKTLWASPRGLGRSPSFKREDHRPVYLGTEYLTQVENLRAAYRCAIASCKERHQESDIEQLQVLCERVLVAMEQWHRRTIQEMRETHAQELERLRQEKEQALAEETQATLAALDAMRKAHEAEVQREVAKFKQDYARQQRDDIMDLSERLSVKCLEAAALQEQLGSATRQLTHAQQHILQLERNPQLSPMQN